MASGVTPTDISAGDGDCLAIGSDANLYTWGANSDGQLGDRTTTNHDSPEVITLASGVAPTAIAAGAFDSLTIGSATPPAKAPETPLAPFLPASAIAAFACF